LLPLLILLAACIDRQPVRGLAVNANFSDRVLTDDLVTQIKVKYITTAGFKPFDKDYRVVAVASWQDRILFRETIDPESPPANWQASRVYEVEKYLYFPAVIDPFNREMASGLRIEFRIMLENGSGSEPIKLFPESSNCCPVRLNPRMWFLWTAGKSSAGLRPLPVRPGANTGPENGPSVSSKTQAAGHPDDKGPKLFRPGNRFSVPGWRSA